MTLQQDEEPFVINKSDDGISVVHKIDCYTIRHQVENDVQDQFPRWDLEKIGNDDNGTVLYRGSVGTEIYRYEARYITRDELLKSDLRYRPCKVCNPDIPSHNRRKSIIVHAAELKVHHLGKSFLGWGTLERFVITGQLNESGRPEIFVDASFGKGVTHRFQSDDVLGYQQQSRAKKSHNN